MIDLTKPIQLFDDTSRGPTTQVKEILWSNENVAVVKDNWLGVEVLINLHSHHVSCVDDDYRFYYAENTETG